MPDLDPVKIKFKGDLNDLRASFTRAKDESRKATDKIAKQWDAMGRKLQSTGKKMTLAITTPFAAFGTLTTKTFAKFERSMQTIVGLVGVAQAQVDAWAASILKIGPAVGRGPVELADAMFFITSAGIRGQAALDALTLSAKASSSGLGETKSVALATVSAMNTWADSGMSAALATDILVKTIREGNLEAGSLAQSLGRLLGTAKAAGAQFRDVGGAMAVMSQQGLNADESATALNSVFSLLLNSGAASEKMLSSVGLTLLDLRRILREEGLLAVMQQLSTSFEGNIKALATFIPNQRALRAVLSITGQDAAKVQRIFDSVGEATGALDEAFGAMAGTADLRANQAAARLQGAMIRFGDTMKLVTIPLTEKFSGALEDLSVRLSGLSLETRETVAGLVAVTAAIGPTLFAVGALAVAFAKLRTSAIVVTVLASLKETLFFIKAGFAGAATSGEVLNAVLLKTKFIAGGVVAVFAAVAVAITLFNRAAREAERAIDDETDAIIRANSAMSPWIAKIEELKKRNTELFQGWRARVRELVAEGMETRVAWVKAWAEMERAGGAAQETMENATRAAAASKEAVQELEEQFEQLRLATRTPEEVLEETLAELEDLRTRLADVGIVGDHIGEVLARAAKMATEQFEGTGDAVRDLKEQFEEMRLEVRTPREELEETLTGLDKFRDALAEIGIEGEEVERVLALVAGQAFEAFSRTNELFDQDRGKEGLREMVAALRHATEETRAQFERLRLSVRTPEEIYKETLIELETLRTKLAEIGIEGGKVEGILARLAERAGEEFEDATRGVDKTAEAVRNLGLTFSSAFEEAIVKMKGVREILRGVEEDILRIFLRTAITEPAGTWLAGQFGSLFTKPPVGSAVGNVFSDGRVQQFRGGGVTSGPVAFPLADGVGVAGERGREAIMPLQRTSRGELGVRAVGGGQSVVIQEGDVIFEVYAMDSRDVARLFDEHSDQIGNAVLKRARSSSLFKQQLLRGG